MHPVRLTIYQMQAASPLVPPHMRPISSLHKFTTKFGELWEADNHRWRWRGVSYTLGIAVVGVGVGYLKSKIWPRVPMNVTKEIQKK
jgi:hypothetical protein